jgi:hypothetical protein
MSTTGRLREQIDACRPGSGDLSLPALAELARAAEHDLAVADELARSQRFDAKVHAALHDIPVPTGLAQRLLETAPGPAPAVEIDLQPTSVACQETRTRRAGLPRRQWMIVGGSLALTVLVAATWYQFWHQQQRVVAMEELGGVVTTWFGTLPSNRWQATALPRGIVIDPAVVAGQSSRWQRFSGAGPTGWSAAVTAIDLTPPGTGGRRTILFVVRSPAKFSVPPRPAPTIRLALSRGLAGTAWQRQGSSLLFVLVVEGQQLENHLRQQPAA